jgi:hypothetical protein
MTGHYCEAKTWRQSRAEDWGESNIGCKRLAVTQVEGRWACKQHAENPPVHGWKEPK